MNRHCISNRIAFTLILSLLLSPTAFSQTVTIAGRITDTVTGNSLSQASIYFTRQAGGTDSTLSAADGSWHYTFTATSVEGGPLLPTDFKISPGYPNPFHPSINIDFSLPESGEVAITVYNTLGEAIDRAAYELNAGAHSIEWSGAGSAGVYFLQFKTGDESRTIKVTQIDGGRVHNRAGFRLSSPSHAYLSKTSTTIPMQIRAVAFGYLEATIDTDVAGGEYFEIPLESIHTHSLVVDLHNDILEKMIENPGYHLADLHTYNHTDIPRLKRGSVDVQFFVVWVNPNSHLHNSYSHAMAMINLFNSEISLSPGDIAQARNTADVTTITELDKIAAVLAVEGGHAIENDLGKLQSLYEAGARYFTITWNNSTDWAVSAQDPRSTTVGLSEFGKEVIAMLDSLGILIDVSHTGIKTIDDILVVSKNPIIATHSGVRALRDHYRNLYDSQIISIAQRGGVIGVVFYPPFLSSSGWADIARVADHIDYIVNLVGIDHAALGSDFDGIGDNTVYGLEDVTKFPDLTLELLRRGYSQAEAGKILGGNFMRVFAQVCGK